MAIYSSLKLPVIWFTIRTGAGPIPSTVVLPAATWVRPLQPATTRVISDLKGGRPGWATYASWIERAHTPNDLAVACRINSSSSDSHLTAILA